jgi:hypothetical protein
MPAIVNSNAAIMCPHGGRVMIVPRQSQILVQGGPALCEPDLVGAPIVGCAQAPSPTTKPCTTVISTLPGSSSPRVLVGGRPVYLSTLSGLTDGVPPGVIQVVDPGSTVNAG